MALPSNKEELGEGGGGLLFEYVKGLSLSSIVSGCDAPSHALRVMISPFLLFLFYFFPPKREERKRTFAPPFGFRVTVA